MNNVRVISTAALVLLVCAIGTGCKRDSSKSSTAESSGSAMTASNAAGPTTEPAPAPALPPAPANLPPPQFKDLPGWLGFATVPKDAKPSLWWTPNHPSAKAVLFTDAWKDVPNRTRLLGLSVIGPTPLEFTGQSTEHYGCEDNTQSMAAFNAPSKLPEGPVWMLPSNQATGAASYPIEAGPVEKNANQRTWTVAGLEFVARKTAPMKGVLDVKDGGKVVAQVEFSKGEMEGSEQKPIDLSSNDEIGVPIPVGAFLLGENSPMVIVLGSRSYEGQNFQLVVRPADAPAHVLGDTVGLYYCAF